MTSRPCCGAYVLHILPIVELKTELMTTTDPYLLKLARVARMYYEQDLTQAEIAEQLGVSRSQISRWLTEARDLGIVEIRIHGLWSRVAELQYQLERRFPIKEALVMDRGGRGYMQVVQGLGVLAANRLAELLEGEMTLGIAWSTGVYQVVSALRSARQKGVTVVQLMGAVGAQNPLLDGPDLTRWLAQTLSGQYRYLPAPLFASDPQAREAIISEPSVREVIELAENADLALVGIGAVSPARYSSLFNARRLTEEDLREIEAKGGVGDICGYFYDIHGQLLDLELHQRLIGVSWEALYRIPVVMGVAGGRRKAAAILGALRSGVIDYLVTDSEAAELVLEMDAAEHPEQEEGGAS